MPLCASPCLFVPRRALAFRRRAAQAAQAGRVLVLDGVQDPGNLGTLLRTACAFGWGAALLLPGCCDPWNDKALRASKGAAFRLPLWSATWPQLASLQARRRRRRLPERLPKRAKTRA